MVVAEPLPLVGPDEIKNGESVNKLRRMILGELDSLYTDHQRQYVRSIVKLLH